MYVYAVTEIIVQFTGDTPNVVGNLIGIEFTANAPLDSAECSVSGTRRQPTNCKLNFIVAYNYLIQN